MTKPTFSELFKSVFIPILILLGTPGATPARASEYRPGSVGPAGGLAIPTLSGQSPRMSLGVAAAYLVHPHWGLGGYFYTSSEGLPEFESLRTTLLGGDLCYALGEGFLHGLQLGVKLGVALLSGGTSDQVPGFTLPGGGSQTVFTVGPKISYDYYLGTGLSMGTEAHVLWLTHRPGVTMTQVLATVKYWFL